MSSDKCVLCGADVTDHGRQYCAQCEADPFHAMREKAEEERKKREAEIARMKAKGYLRTRTVTAFQKIKSV